MTYIVYAGIQNFQGGITMANTLEQKMIASIKGQITRVNIINDGKAVEIYCIPEGVKGEDNTNASAECNYEVKVCLEKPELQKVVQDVEDIEEVKEIHRANDAISDPHNLPFITEPPFGTLESCGPYEWKGLNLDRYTGTYIRGKLTSDDITLFDEFFPIVPASELSIKDPVFQHVPITVNERDLKELLQKVLKRGLKDFRAQAMAPSCDDDGNIFYEAGTVLPEDRTWASWHEMAKNFIPEKHTRLGNVTQRIALIAYIMKYLHEIEGWKIHRVWNFVCDGKDISNYACTQKENWFKSPGTSQKLVHWYDLVGVPYIMVEVKKRDTFFANKSYWGRGSRILDVISDLSISDKYSENDDIGWIVADV